MSDSHSRSSLWPIHPESPFQVATLICGVATLSYLAARLGGALVIRPEMIWPVWPGCALLVAVSLLTSKNYWPAVLLAGLLGFAVYDVKEALPLRAIVLLLVADTIEILIAAFGVSYVFGGVPRLNSVKSLAKYSFFAVILAPVSVASVALDALESDSWWVGFFTEALALLTLTPAILSWVEIVTNWVERPKARYLEVALMSIGFATLSYLAFVEGHTESRPAMLYSLVPFLLWAALRFGTAGTSTLLTILSYLAILSTVHKRGPFTGSTPVHDVLSLQLFLLVAAASFLVLAAAVEEHKAAERALRESEQTVRTSEQRLRLAQQAARIGTFEWNVQTGVNTWTSELESIYGLPAGGFGRTQAAFEKSIHPEDLATVKEVVDQALKTGEPNRGEWRVVWPDGSVHWIAGRWQVFRTDSGDPSRVIGVNIDITERKRAAQMLEEVNQMLEAQAALLQSREELLRIFVQNVPAAVAMFDRDMRYMQVSDRWCTDFSVSNSEILGRSHYEIFPDLPDRWKKVHRRALAGETLRADEDRWDRESGTMWSRWEIRPWRNVDGTLGGILIFSEDITHRKQMEDNLLEMSRKLIASQEQERARIGRELHDDINQQLAMLALEMQQILENPSLVQSRGTELRNQLGNLSADVQALSHDLHSSKLEYLGVVTGIRSWCREFAQRQKIDIDFTSDVSHPLPMEIGLTLFRVLQEALHNAVKHSGAVRVEVDMREHPADVELTIHDSGKGFDVEQAMQGTGLGLTSIQERVRLVNGTIAIDSKPTIGTSIHVHVPLPTKQILERAAG